MRECVHIPLLGNLKKEQLTRSENGLHLFPPKLYIRNFTNRFSYQIRWPFTLPRIHIIIFLAKSLSLHYIFLCRSSLARDKFDISTYDPPQAVYTTTCHIHPKNKISLSPAM